jgi:hypothetical protein
MGSLHSLYNIVVNQFVESILMITTVACRAVSVKRLKSSRSAQLFGEIAQMSSIAISGSELDKVFLTVIA